jgi:hypothetical protein
VKDQIVDFVVTVDQCAAVFGLSVLVSEEGDHFVEVRDRADGDLGIDVDCATLVGGEDGEGLYLSVVEIGVAAEGGEANG